jgi:hypothetical protein
MKRNCDLQLEARSVPLPDITLTNIVLELDVTTIYKISIFALDK